MAIRCPKCHFENSETARFCSNCAASLQPTEKIPASLTETLQAPIKELSTGTTFAGRYQIIEELGKGGMGKVYKVFDTKIKEKVALKLIKPEIASDRETIERFSNELRLARKIAQRNVCKMFDLGEAEGAHFITMEYVHGEDLKSMIRMTGSLNVGAVLSIGKQVCDGLAEAHSLGVVHRDLKPQNIMIDKGGNAKIMDFGIARSLREKGITGASMMIGTPEYMSPEQAEAKEVDQRSDIYSLGIILYEMATGRVPFEGETALSIAMKHKGEAPRDPKQLNPNIPEDLSGIILKCLEKDKTKRYQSAGDVRAELEKIEKGIPTTERVVPERKTLTSREITVKFTPKKLFLPALGIIALAVIALLILRFFPRKQPVAPPLSGKPSLAILYFENISGDKTLDPWKTALTELLITKLSQSKFIRVLDINSIFSILKKLNLDEAKKYTKEDLQKVANEGGASHTLSGSLMKAGETIIINLTLQKPSTGEVITSQAVPCKSEAEIFPKLDEVTKEIKSGLNLSRDQIASDIDKHLGTITTSSPEAFKDFNAARNLQRRGFNRDSIKFYERAITDDPQFAPAFLFLGFAYGNLGYPSMKIKYVRKAFELRDKVTERENLLIQAVLLDLSEKTYEKAIEVLKRLVELYPEDYFGNILLGNSYRNLEEWDKAVERDEVCIQNKYNPTYPFSNQAQSYRSQGLYDKAREVCEKYLNYFGDNASIHLSLASTYLCEGKYENALNEIDKAFLISPESATFETKGNVYNCMGDSYKAETEYQNLLSVEEQSYRLNGRYKLGALYLSQGKFGQSKDQLQLAIEEAEKLDDDALVSDSHTNLAYAYLVSRNDREALEECNKAWNSAAKAESLTRQTRTLHLKGLSYLEMNTIEDAKRVAEELKRLVDSWMNKKLMRYYYHLVGMMELRKGTFSKAIENLNQARSLLAFQSSASDQHALFLGPLAFVYYKAGELEKARIEYEAITALTTGRLNYGDIYAKAYYMLGKIGEQQGQKQKAVENYHKFLGLWKDADPGIPEVEDARNRLAALKEF